MAEQLNGDGKRSNKPGLYRHPDTGAEIFVTQHHKFGSSMADGVVTQGYEWVQSEMPEQLAKPGLGKEAALAAENEELRAKLAEAEAKAKADEEQKTKDEAEAKAKAEVKKDTK